jgi:hypothetical protein
VIAKAADIQKSISEGATSFLTTEYYYLGIFMVRSTSRGQRQPEIAAGGART